MNILRPKAQPVTDVEKWVSKLADLQRDCQTNERETAAALAALGSAILAGQDDGGEALARLEAKRRGLSLAIEEAQRQLEAAKEAERERQMEGARLAEQKLLGELRAQWIDYGKALAAELAALQKVFDAHRAYNTNHAALPGTANRADALGSPSMWLDSIVNHARSLEVKLGADYALTGLPKYNLITLERKP